MDLGQTRPGALIESAAQVAHAVVTSAPAPLGEGDLDGDGLPDALEQSLADRYAPVVLLDQADWTRPASVSWVLARHDVTRPPGSPMIAAIAQTTARATGRLAPDVRAGSVDPSDWTTYVHVYPRVDGGINIQYWFYYPYNDGPAFFDHEGDWEHVTVRLDRQQRPLGLALAQHEDNDPGVYRSWRNVRRDGDHPVVLSARGSHASYASLSDVPWFDRATSCDDLQACDQPIWRTWEGGGLANVGERGSPLAHSAAMSFSGRWGAAALLPGTSAPVGPFYARGFCNAGFKSCGGTVGASTLSAAR